MVYKVKMTFEVDLFEIPISNQFKLKYTIKLDQEKSRSFLRAQLAKCFWFEQDVFHTFGL